MFEPTQNALFVHIAPISDLCQSFAIYEIATLSYMIGMSKETHEHHQQDFKLCIIQLLCKSIAWGQFRSKRVSVRLL